ARDGQSRAGAQCPAVPVEWRGRQRVRARPAHAGRVNGVVGRIRSGGGFGAERRCRPELWQLWPLAIGERPLLPSLRDAPGSFCLTSAALDRKSTRLNSSHVSISYAVFCLKKNTGDDKALGRRA